METVSKHAGAHGNERMCVDKRTNKLENYEWQVQGEVTEQAV